MNTQEQLDQNVATVKGALSGSFTSAETEAVEITKEAIVRGFKVPCTGCGYCLPCPHGVNIPMCFLASLLLSNSVLVGDGDKPPFFANRAIALEER